MKIEELTSKIYEEGVEKAKQQGEELLSRARKEADRLVSEAKSEAEAIVETARKDAEQQRARIDAEIRLAAEQSMTQLRSRITDALVDNMLPKSIESALSDTGFVQNLIHEIVTRWDTSETSIDIAVVLPKKTQKEMAQFFAAKARGLLDKGLELSFSSELKSGFQIRPKDGSYRISFLEEDFVSFFRSFLRERTRNILFSTDDEGQTQP